MDVRSTVLQVASSLVEDSTKVIDEDSQISSLGIDSMDLMDLVFQVQELCGVEFSNEDLLPSKLNTIGAIIKNVERLRADSPTPST